MDYEINSDTLVVMPVNKNSTKIIEKEDEYFIKNNALSIMEHSCEYFGSSYEGRKEGTKKLLGISHKSPIIVEESRQIIFFPTESPESSNCYWINLGLIDKYYKSGKKKSSIQFKNGEIIDFDISIGSLTNQIMRASRLKYILEDRIDIKKDNYY